MINIKKKDLKIEKLQVIILFQILELKFKTLVKKNTLKQL